MADRFLRVEHAVAVGIAQAPQVGRDGRVDVAARVHHDAAEDVGRDVLVEALEHDRRLVGDAVAVGVLDAEDSLGHAHQIAEVAHAVLVEVGDPGVLVAQLGRHLLAEELAQVLGGLQPLDLRHPVGVLAGVEPLAAARRRADVGRRRWHRCRWRASPPPAGPSPTHSPRGRWPVEATRPGGPPRRTCGPRRHRVCTTSPAFFGGCFGCLHRHDDRQAHQGCQGETGERHPARATCKRACRTTDCEHRTGLQDG